MIRLVLTLMILSGCSKPPEQDPIVAIVNGEKIYKSTLVDFLPPHARDQDITPYFERLRERAVHVELALKKALADVKPNDPAIIDEFAKIRTDVTLEHFRQKIKKEVLTESNLKAAFEEFKKDNPPQTEVHARHILVNSEAEAQDIESKIAAGEDFGQLADKLSIDKNAKQGELGFFRADDMVKPFSEKVFTLRDAMATRLKNQNFSEKKGDRGIVQTDFGWHVVEVLESRTSSYPPYDEVKETLESKLLKNRIDEITDKLRKSKNIQLFNLDGTVYQENHHGKIDPTLLNKANPVLIKIDNKEFTKKDLLTLIPNSSEETNIQPYFDRLIKEFVRRELLKEEALKAMPANDKEIEKEVHIISHRMIVNTYLEREVKKRLKDQDMQKLYTEYIAKNPPATEVHARHILVDSEDAAKEIVSALQQGEKFETLAQTKSKDKGAKDGDLNYFRYEDMVPEFSAKAFSLKMTEPDGKPDYGIVKSSFGWHVIELLDKREGTQPSFEEAKAMLHPQASQRIVDELMVELRKTAKVELFDLPKKAGEAAVEKTEKPAVNK